MGDWFGLFWVSACLPGLDVLLDGYYSACYTLPLLLPPFLSNQLQLCSPLSHYRFPPFDVSEEGEVSCPLWSQINCSYKKMWQLVEILVWTNKLKDLCLFASHCAALSLDTERVVWHCVFQRKSYTSLCFIHVLHYHLAAYNVGLNQMSECDQFIILSVCNTFTYTHVHIWIYVHKLISMSPLHLAIISVAFSLKSHHLLSVSPCETVKKRNLQLDGAHYFSPFTSFPAWIRVDVEAMYIQTVTPSFTRGAGGSMFDHCKSIHLSYWSLHLNAVSLLL